MKKKPKRGRPPGSKTRKGIQVQTPLKREKGARISVSLNEQDFAALVASGGRPTQFVRGLRETAATAATFGEMKAEIEASISDLIDRKIPDVKSMRLTDQGQTVEPSQLNGFIDFIAMLPAVASIHQKFPSEINDELIDAANGHLTGFWLDLRNRLLAGLTTEYDPADRSKALMHEAHWGMAAAFLSVTQRIKGFPIQWGIAPLHALRHQAIARIFIDLIGILGNAIFDHNIQTFLRRQREVMQTVAEKRVEMSERYGIPLEPWETSALLRLHK